jgi:hypothetical protein
METLTWLPVYDSELFQTDDYSEKQYLEENGITEIELDEFWYNRHVDDQKQNYYDECQQTSVDFITAELKDLGYIHSAEGNAKNYCVRIDTEHLKKIKADIIKYKDLWAIYLEEHYKSYNGFMSFHDHRPDDDDWKSIVKALKHEHRCGAILQFLLYANSHKSKWETGSERVQYDLRDYVSERVYFGVNPEEYRKALREQGFYDDKLELLEEICKDDWIDFYKGCDLSEYDDTPEIARFVELIGNREFYKLLNEMQPKLFTTENLSA